MNRALNIVLLIVALGFVVWLAVGGFGDEEDGKPEGPPPPLDPIVGSGAKAPPRYPAATYRSGKQKGRLDPDAPLPDIRDAAALVKMGEWEDALNRLDRILEADPEDVEALTLRGRAHLRGEMLRMAEKDFRRAREKGGESVERLVDHAATLSRLRRRDEALKLLTQAAEMDPADARAHAQLARLHFDAGRKKEAKVEADAALAIDPSNPLANSVMDQLER